MAIYILKNGEKQGPYEESIVAGWLMNGTCSPQDLAWRDGMKEWQPLSTIPLLQATPQSGSSGGTLIAILGGLILAGSIVVFLLGDLGQPGSRASELHLKTLGELGFFLGLGLLIAGIIVTAIRKR